MLRTVPAWQCAGAEVVPVLVAVYEGTGKDVVDYCKTTAAYSSNNAIDCGSVEDF